MSDRQSDRDNNLVRAAIRMGGDDDLLIRQLAAMMLTTAARNLDEVEREPWEHLAEIYLDRTTPFGEEAVLDQGEWKVVAVGEVPDPFEGA